MWHSSRDPQVRRFASLEQELDELYGDLGLPKPEFGQLTVRRLAATGDDTRTARGLRSLLKRGH